MLIETGHFFLQKSELEHVIKCFSLTIASLDGRKYILKLNPWLVIEGDLHLSHQFWKRQQTSLCHVLPLGKCLSVKDV